MTTRQQLASLDGLAGTYDLRLSDWGPYTKRYAGISHLPDHHTGLRFDLSVFPGYYRAKVAVPNVVWESGFHPWEASADLSYFCNRHELEWRDQVYCDISYAAWPDGQADSDQRLIRCECVNETAQPQNLVLHYMASLQCPALESHARDLRKPVQVQLPPGGLWIDALDYAHMAYATTRPTDSLVPDGKLRGEIREYGFVGHTGLGQGFGAEAGDTLTYRLDPDQTAGKSWVIRYRALGGPVTLRCDGALSGALRLPASDELTTLLIPAQLVNPDASQLTLTATGDGPMDLDGIALVDAAQVAAVTFVEERWDVYPHIADGPVTRSLLLKYGDIDGHYGLAWSGEPWQLRQFYSDELDTVMRHTVHHHTRAAFRGQGEGHFTNIFVRPIELAPHSRRVLYGLVCAGSESQVNDMLRGFAAQPDRWESVYAQARARRQMPTGSSSGSKYDFGQERMAATTLTNLVYPTYTKPDAATGSRYIRHYSPGRWWDSLYTWDAGFVGLGLSQLDPNRAVDCLNAYVTEPGDEQTAFIHHGSPVPVQFYVFQELWNQTQDRALLAHFYPRLRQYHRFMAGRLGSSTTYAMKSNLLKTWDYFYNSGGWDDYPPQVHVHRHGLEDTVTPAVTSSHVIRAAKTLNFAARTLALEDTAWKVEDDLAEYDADIATLTQALQDHAWDPDAGYFSYVVHDEEGQPTGFLRHRDRSTRQAAQRGAVNYNMGLDGASPLIAGICTPEQRKLLLERLMSPERMWTHIGLSTVDRSAPYYRVDGYWNGAVWMPHQWFFWKALLDLGENQLARRIALTALEVWKAEVDASYNCFEHFIVQSGRGAGWHQFSGLSCPVLYWYNSYFKPGTLTGGHDTWVLEKSVSADNTRIQARVWLGQHNHHTTLLAAVNPHYVYRVTWNDVALWYDTPFDGLLEIPVPLWQREATIDIRPVVTT